MGTPATDSAVEVIASERINATHTVVLASCGAGAGYATWLVDNCGECMGGHHFAGLVDAAGDYDRRRRRSRWVLAASAGSVLAR